MSANHEDVIKHLSVPRYAPRLQPTAIPEAAWNDAPLRGLCVNEEWMAHILGVLIALDQQDTWLGTDEEIWLARQQVNEIMLAFMEDCGMDCCLPPLTRVLDDGSVEVSYDGGATWSPATTEDPRKAAPKLPDVADGEGADKKCKAANRVTQQMKDLNSQWSSNLGTGLGIVQLALAFAAGVAVLFFTAGTTISIIVPALLSLASAVVGTGHTAYDALFTDSVWNAYFCKVYCHIGEDGQFDQGAFNDLLADLDSFFSGTVALAFSSALRGWQLEGLNNAARVPTSLNMDCADCDCDVTCNLENWSVWDGGESYGNILEVGTNYLICEAELAAGTVGEYFFRAKTPNSSICCNITHVEIITGSDINLNHYDQCESTQGTFGSTWSLSTGTNGNGCSTFRFGSPAYAKLKFFFD